MVAIFTGTGSGFEKSSVKSLGDMGLLGSSSLGRATEGVFLNGATGNLIVSRQDEFLVGRGPDVSVARTYNSLGNLSDENGDNWRQSTDKRIKNLTGTVNTAGSTITRVDGDGSEVVYTYDTGKGVYISKEGGKIYDKIQTSGPYDWVWTDGDTNRIERYTYANGTTTTWRLANVADPEFVGGVTNIITYTYHAGTDKVDTVSTANGDYIKYGWSGNNITKVETYTGGGSPALTRAYYDYDAYNRLSAVTVDLNPTDNNRYSGSSYTTSYTYIDTISRRIQTVSQTDGSSLTFEYDVSNRVKKITQAVATGVTRVTDIVYDGYDAGDMLYYTDITSAGLTTRIKYDGSNQLRKVVSPPPVSGGTAQVVEFHYNGNGDVDWIKDQAGNTTSYTSFDSWGAWLTRQDRLGNTVTRTYSTAGRNQLLSETWTGSDASSASASHTTRYVYDSEVHLRYKISAEGHVTEYEYDNYGQVTSQIEYPEAVFTGGTADLTSLDAWVTGLGNISWARRTDYTYDARGNMLTAKSWGFATSGGLGDGTELYTLTNYTYDQAGQLLSTTRDGENPTSYLYDGLGRVYSTTAANGGTTTIAFTDASTTTTVTLASGRVTTSVYNKAGELLTVTDSGFNPTKYSYDSLGRLRVVKDASGRYIHYYYDNVGRKIAEVAGDGSSSIANLTEYRYDQNNRLVATASYVSKALPGGGSFHDANDDIIEKTLTDLRPSADAADVWEWRVYDNEDRLIQSIQGDGSTVRYEYDASNRLIRTTAFYNKIGSGTVAGFKTTSPTALTLPTADSNKDSVARTFYDKDGRLLGQLDGQGYLSRVYYDKAGQKTEEVAFVNATGSASAVDRTTAMLDALVTSITASSTYDRRTRYVYDGRQLRYVVDASNQVTQYDYDTAGRAILTIGYAGSISATSDYTFDNIKSLVTASGLASNANTRKSWSVYDTAGRVRYTLDGESTTSSDAVVTGFTYDSQDRVIKTVRYANRRSTTSLPTLSDMTGTWDSAQLSNSGNRITRNFYNSRGDLSYTHDAENYVVWHDYDQAQRLVRTRRYDTAQASITEATSLATIAGLVASSTYADRAWAYDPAGRVSDEYDGLGVVTHYVYAGTDLVQTKYLAYGTADQARYDYTYDAAGRMLTEVLPKSSVRYYDGAVMATTVTNRFTYDGRGNRLTMVEAYGLSEARTTTYVYDKIDQLIEIQHDSVSVLNATDFVSTSSVQPKEYLTYDAFGNVIERKDANNARTLCYYDRLGRKVVEINAVGTYSAYGYDALGNLTSSKVYGTAVSLPGSPGGTPPSAPGGEYRETTFTYDRLGQVKTSAMAGIRTGAWNGSTYATSVVTVTTSFDYDARGNLIRTVDGNGGAIYSYYNRNNLKVAQLDQENYLTVWQYDARGNVKNERRHAVKYPGLPSLGGSAPAMGFNDDDRYTIFTYDANDRRLYEQRSGVVAWTVNPTTGALTAASTTSTVAYTYNGLGLVSSKQEATLDTVSYTYDGTGRLTKESRASYSDYLSSTVTPTVEYFYNGVDNLSRTRQGGASAGGGDRITTYAYDVGGRLTTMTDAAGNARNYFHDAAGNVLRDSYSRARGDSAAVTDGILYTYDLMGRIVSQRMSTLSGTWASSEAQATVYNAYGEVASRAFGGVTQENFAYDLAGRLWRTNSGDGVWRYFIYDANGAQTAAIESVGYNLDNLTMAQAIDAADGAGGTIGSSYIAGLNATINVVDKRGQATSTRLPQRQLAAASYATLIVNRTYNAFGEVASESDPRNATWLTEYKYNTMGRLIEKKAPSVSTVSETNVTTSERPTETYYYDISGRLVAMRDPAKTLAGSGYSFSRTLLAGTGYGGGEALVLKEFHPDGGVAQNLYDVFGDARILRNELSQDETRTYDGMGRVLTVAHRGGLLTDTYVYDLLGQRIKHTNNFLGVGNAEITDYDRLGRVTRQVAFGGDTTTMSYVWNSALSTGGMATFGGWEKTTTFANTSKTMVEKTDHFGRAVQKVDMWPHTWNYTYDRGGRMTLRADSGVTDQLVYNVLNTGLVGSMTNGGTSSSTFTYDEAGNRLTEVVVNAGTTIQNSSATYDAIGRMTHWQENGPTSSVLPAASMDIYYDLNSNVRHTAATFWSLDGAGAPVGSTGWDWWNRYDSMNRVTTDKGGLVGGVITGGTTLTYNAAGQRVTSTQYITGLKQKLWKHTSSGGTVTWWDYQEDLSGGTWLYTDYSYNGYRRETYNYNADGTLAYVQINQDTVTGNGFAGPPTVNLMSGAGATRANYSYDAMTRMTRQIDWNGNGTDAAYDRTIVYNGKGQITDETVISKQGADTFTNYITNTYGTGSGYALGAIVTVTSDNWKNGSDGGAADTSTTNSFSWYDGAVQSGISYDSDTGSGSNPIWTTSYSYSLSGILNSVSISDGRPRTITYTNDLTGQVLRRDEADGNGAAGDPHEVWYRFNGREMGTTGNNYTLETDYTTSIANRQIVPGTGAFRFGATGAGFNADFNASLDPINSYAQGGAGGSHIVRAGDTLTSIAANLWGDSSLWYKLAEANGLSGNNALIEGQNLIIPAGVMKNSHNASTFKPYDSSEVIGETSPTNPKPNKRGNQCGGFGAILMVAVAVAVTIATSGALAAASLAAVTGNSVTIGAGLGALAGSAATGASLTTFGMVAIGATAAAAGSIASQGLGVATGIQDKFSWKGVAMAAISGGVGGGLGLAMPGGGVLGAGVRGAVGSAMSQGIAVATGLQPKFDWAGVAAAGIGAGVGQAVGGRLPSLRDNNSISNHLRHLGTSAATAIANAATRSLMNGSDFGDNMLAALPDVLGSTVGNLIGYGASRASADPAPPPPGAAVPNGADPSTTSTTESVPEPTTPREIRRAERQRARDLEKINDLLSMADASLRFGSDIGQNLTDALALPLGQSQATVRDLYLRMKALGQVSVQVLSGADPGYIYERLRTLSTPILTFIDRHNIPFIAANHNMAELGVSGTAHGWPSHTTYQDLDGLFHQSRYVAVATDGSARPNTFFHELGHAIDRALGWRSQQPAFQALWTQDGTFAGYFAQGDGWGYKETFAESFARHVQHDAPSVAWNQAHPLMAGIWNNFPW